MIKLSEFIASDLDADEFIEKALSEDGIGTVVSSDFNIPPNIVKKDKEEVKKGTEEMEEYDFKTSQPVRMLAEDPDFSFLRTATPSMLESTDPEPIDFRALGIIGNSAPRAVNEARVNPEDIISRMF